MPATPAANPLPPRSTTIQHYQQQHSLPHVPVQVVLSPSKMRVIINLYRVLMGKKTVSPQRQMFFSTIRDVRKMVDQHRGNYARDTLGLTHRKPNTKVPFVHLEGRRGKLRQRHKKEKERSREEAIQYDSSMKMLNSSLMEMRKEKDSFQKNQYKYQQISEGRVGREQDGFLKLTKQDVQRIRGREGESSGTGRSGGKGKRLHKGKRKGKKHPHKK